jgi:hypothetical protein
MALKKTITAKDNFGIEVTIPETYIKVESTLGNKNEQQIVVSFTKNNSLLNSKQYLFTPNMDGDNFIKQAYLHLKTLPEFADSVDC